MDGDRILGHCLGDSHQESGPFHWDCDMSKKYLLLFKPLGLGVGVTLGLLLWSSLS